MRGLLIAGVLGVLSVGVATPTLAQVGSAVVRVDARSEVAAALYAASATQAAAERAADARLRAQAAEIERLKREGRASRDLIAALQEQYVRDLAARDRAYAQEIAVFRNAVEDIAKSPEGAAALARFNAGDWPGARTIMQQIVSARARARAVAVAIQDAADKRTFAALSLEARARGQEATAAVIALYEDVTRLDPGVHWDWVELGRLYQDKGDLPNARRAAQRAAETAANGRDRAVALNELGDVLVAQGDLAGARARFQESLDIAKRLADADKSSASLQRDVWVSMSRLQRFPDSGVTWAKIAAVMEDMERRGVLLPTDQRFLAQARANATKERAGQ